jgi:hypothetical protein
VRWPPTWVQGSKELVREVQFSHCELLLLDAGSCGMGLVREPIVRVTYTVGSRYQATTEDTADGKDLACTVVKCSVCVCVCVCV